MDQNVSGSNRICKRCLLSEFDEKKYLEEIKEYIDILDASTKVAEEEYKNRLEVCRGCDKLLQGTCLACGCFVEIRAVVKDNRCPKKKW
ncbi:DUF6171 family protein [Eubacterium ruminantium]|uniref:DUF6171 family protein n=1 Tax=Eubacterium ruminantium TaxID=42322 RepID=UPI0015694700|nr:DUF6171 family protein [Eubacterium ruminantium]